MGNNKGVWKGNDINVVKIVYKGKVYEPKKTEPQKKERSNNHE